MKRCCKGGKSVLVGSPGPADRSARGGARKLKTANEDDAVDDDAWRGRRGHGAVGIIKNSRCASQCGDVDGERRFDGTVRPVVVVLAETKEEYYLRSNDAERIREDDRPSRCNRGVISPVGPRRRPSEDETRRATGQGWPQGIRACHRGSQREAARTAPQ